MMRNTEVLFHKPRFARSLAALDFYCEGVNGARSIGDEEQFRPAGNPADRDAVSGSIDQGSDSCTVARDDLDSSSIAFLIQAVIDNPLTVRRKRRTPDGILSRG